MTHRKFKFQNAEVNYYFDSSIEHLKKYVQKSGTVVLADENFYLKNKKKLSGWKVIVIPSGETNKVQSTVDNIIKQLIELGADRSTTLLGVGGGVVTDITGYVASIYKRGVRFAFIPTTILAMTDAAIGGKNGINVGLYKNVLGTIKQPDFILYDYSLLKSLPQEEWINGFAEIIKHACIKDARMFAMLEANTLKNFKSDTTLLANLIQKNALLKSKITASDEFEKSNRKQLNFGHTLGHAIENLYNIPHGHAVSIGMGIACKISELLLHFNETKRIVALLKKYGLPPQFEFDKAAVWKILLGDKKINADQLDYILIGKIGKSVIHRIPLSQFHNMLNAL